MSNPSQQWNVLSLLEWTSNHLAEKGFDEARLHVELLLAHVLRLKRLDLYLQFDRPLSPEELSQFRRLYERRLKHEPLQYILGETEFMGVRLEVASGVLIPRPETELLVERALEVVRDRRWERPEILDIGCGAGNIGVPLAKRFPAGTVWSVDRDPLALDLTKRNAELHNIGNMKFMQMDILHDTFMEHRFDLILSNPPYIPSVEMAGLQQEVRDFEPAAALTDGGDGFAFYKRYAEILPALLNPEGVVLVEVGYAQAAEVSEIFAAAGLGHILRHTDFGGIERAVEAWKQRGQNGLEEGHS